MTDIVPKCLLNLPGPWRDLKAEVEEVLLPGDAGRSTTLQVLDRCLQALEELPNVTPDEFPDFVRGAWSLWASSFATMIPSFDEFRLEPITKAFRKQDPEVTEAFVLRYAQAWLRKQALERAEEAANWLFCSLRTSPRSETLDAFRGICERRWRADEEVAATILYDLWLLDPRGSRALLEAVAASPDAPKELVTELNQLLLP